MSALLCPCSDICCLFVKSVSQLSTAVIVIFRSSWVFWIGDTCSSTSAPVISQRCPLHCGGDDPRLFPLLFGSKIRSCITWERLSIVIRAFLSCSWVCPPSFWAAPAESCPVCCFWRTDCIERRLCEFCFLPKSLRCLRYIPTVSCACGSCFCDLLLEVSLDWLRSNLLFFVGDVFFFCLCSHEPFCSILDVDDLGEELSWNCVVT